MNTGSLARSSSAIDAESGSSESDRQYLSILHEIERYYRELNRGYQIRVEKWIWKLSCTGANPTWKKHRNAYAKLLCNMILNKDLGGPFATVPPEGPLSSFPVHLRSYSVKGAAGWSSGAYLASSHLSSFWRDLYQKVHDSPIGLDPNLASSKSNNLNLALSKLEPDHHHLKSSEFLANTTPQPFTSTSKDHGEKNIKSNGCKKKENAKNVHFCASSSDTISPTFSECKGGSNGMTKKNRKDKVIDRGNEYGEETSQSVTEFLSSPEELRDSADQLKEIRRLAMLVREQGRAHDVLQSQLEIERKRHTLALTQQQDRHSLELKRLASESGHLVVELAAERAASANIETKIDPSTEEKIDFTKLLGERDKEINALKEQEREKKTRAPTKDASTCTILDRGELAPLSRERTAVAWHTLLDMQHELNGDVQPSYASVDPENNGSSSNKAQYAWGDIDNQGYVPYLGYQQQMSSDCPTSKGHHFELPEETTTLDFALHLSRKKDEQNSFNGYSQGSTGISSTLLHSPPRNFAGGSVGRSLGKKSSVGSFYRSIHTLDNDGLRAASSAIPIENCLREGEKKLCTGLFEHIPSTCKPELSPPRTSANRAIHSRSSIIAPVGSTSARHSLVFLERNLKKHMWEIPDGRWETVQRPTNY